MRVKHFGLYCCVIAFVIYIPLICTLINLYSNTIWHKELIVEPKLDGVISVPEKPQFSVKTFCSGEFQSGVEDFIENRLVTRNTLTRIYNQILYSVFHSSDNTEILRGGATTFLKRTMRRLILQSFPRTTCRC